MSFGCYKCGSRSHKTINCSQKKCFVCKKDGHDEKSCFFNSMKKYCHFHCTKMHDNTECRVQMRSNSSKMMNINNVEIGENSNFPQINTVSDNNQYTGWVSQDLTVPESEN